MDKNNDQTHSEGFPASSIAQECLNTSSNANTHQLGKRVIKEKEKNSVAKGRPTSKRKVLEDEETRHQERLKYIRDACRKSRQKKLDLKIQLENEVETLQNELWRLTEMDRMMKERISEMTRAFEDERRTFRNR